MGLWIVPTTLKHEPTTSSVPRHKSITLPWRISGHGLKSHPHIYTYTYSMCSLLIFLSCINYVVKILINHSSMLFTLDYLTLEDCRSPCEEAHFAYLCIRSSDINWSRELKLSASSMLVNIRWIDL